LKQKAHARFKISDCIDLQQFASNLLLHELPMSLHGLSSMIHKAVHVFKPGGFAYCKVLIFLNKQCW